MFRLLIFTSTREHCTGETLFSLFYRVHTSLQKEEKKKGKKRSASKKIYFCSQQWLVYISCITSRTHACNYFTYTQYLHLREKNVRVLIIKKKKKSLNKKKKTVVLKIITLWQPNIIYNEAHPSWRNQVLEGNVGLQSVGTREIERQKAELHDAIGVAQCCTVKR